MTDLRLTLRDYQLDALKRTAMAEGRGITKQLGVAATGLGKTVIFTALAKERGGRTLILAHRDELVNQAAAKVREVWPGIDVGIVKAGSNDVHAHVVVASVQTLAREKRMAQLLAPFGPDAGVLTAADPFGLVVVDEAHHAAAVTYKTILKELQAGEPDGPLLLGVTATPDRGDGKGLDDLFQEIVWSCDMLWGIRSGYLSELRGLSVSVADMDMSHLKVTAGDYNQGQAGRLMEDAQAHRYVVQAWQRHAEGRRTLVFTPTVAVAALMADEFAHAGIPAAYIHAGTPMDDRRRILSDYSAGRLQVLANCAVLTEGYDEPRTDCIVVARPTKSRALYTQMVGRGTRRHPDKADCLVLDVVGAAGEHSLVTIPSLFGLDKKFAKRMGDGTGALSEVVLERDEELVKLGKLKAEAVELFKQVRQSGVAWVEITKPGALMRRYCRSLGSKDRPTVVLAQATPEADDWNAGLLMPDGTKKALIMHVPMEMAQGVGEDYVRRFGPASMTRADAAWRKHKPTPKQKALARRLHIDTNGKNAGEVSDAIDAHMSGRRLTGARR